MTRLKKNTMKHRHAKSTGKPRTSSDRRGSVLLMVVGVLALMAIIAVVYAAIASADRRGSAAFVRANQFDDQMARMTDYVIDIIGRDRLEPVYLAMPGVNPNQTVRLPVRKTWDYGSVDPSMVSTFPGANELPFSPIGNGYSAWLSMSEPTKVELGLGKGGLIGD